MIPTAEEFILEKYESLSKENTNFTEEIDEESLKVIVKWHIEFAKLHVEAALENAAKYADLHSKYKPKIGEKPDINCNKYIYQPSILNSYDLNQIK